MALELPNRVIDYVLYYECGSWEKANPSLWSKVGSITPGGLLQGVNWSSQPYDGHDAGGQKTKCGVLVDYAKKNGYVINSANNWLGYLKKYFWEQSCAPQCANIATAVQVFQGKWGGWTNSAMQKVIASLKSKADKSTSGIGDSGYSNVAKLTHCFTNPMDAFVIIRSARIAYLRSCGNASKFANGWMRREFFAMQTDGLYVETGRGTSKYGFTPIADMEKVAAQLKKDPSSGYQKLLDWNGPISSNIGEGLSDGSDGSYNPSIFSNGSSFSGGENINYQHGVVDGGTFSGGLNKANTQKGLILGVNINNR